MAIFLWWIARIRNQIDQVDYLRIDHFRGFEAYWEVLILEASVFI